MARVRRFVGTWVALAAALAGCAGAEPEGCVEASARFADVDGYVQIPRAGAAGSTSWKRPTFEETGVSSVSFLDVEARGGAGGTDLFGGFQEIRPSGSATLTDDLVSQGTAFPAGTLVRERFTLDWYRVGVEEWLALGVSGFAVAPRLGFAFVRLDQRLIAADGSQVSRGFSHGALLLGARARWTAGAFAVEARGGIAPQLPIRDQLALYGAELLGSLRIAFLAPFVGVGFERFDSLDTERPAHNHVRLVLAPLFAAGASVGF